MLHFLENPNDKKSEKIQTEMVRWENDVRKAGIYNCQAVTTKIGLQCIR